MLSLVSDSASLASEALFLVVETLSLMIETLSLAVEMMRTTREVTSTGIRAQRIAEKRKKLTIIGSTVAEMSASAKN